MMLSEIMTVVGWAGPIRRTPGVALMERGQQAGLGKGQGEMMNGAKSLLEGRTREERPVVLFYEENKCICLKDEGLSLSLKGVVGQRIKRTFRFILFSLCASIFFFSLKKERRERLLTSYEEKMVCSLPSWLEVVLTLF